MNKKYSLSIIVPCFDEEKNVRDTVEQVVKVIGGIEQIDDYEILVINDCSRDKTLEIAHQLSKENPRVRVLNNEKNMGLGYNYKHGVFEATKDYVMLVPGDNELSPVSVKLVCEHIGEADIILPHPSNANIRPWFRQIISSAFTGLLNFITGYKLKYYNGNTLQKRKYLLDLEYKTNGMAYQADLLIQMLRRGHTYVEVPTLLNYSSNRHRILRPKSIMNVTKTLLEIPFAARFKAKKLQKKLESAD